MGNSKEIDVMFPHTIDDVIRESRFERKPAARRAKFSYETSDESFITSTNRIYIDYLILGNINLSFVVCSQG